MGKTSKTVAVMLNLRCPGNPDFGETGPVAPAVDRVFATAKDAVAFAMMYRDQHDLGGGNWVASLHRSGKKVAVLSYNGRLWSPTDERAELTPEEV